MKQLFIIAGFIILAISFSQAAYAEDARAVLGGTVPDSPITGTAEFTRFPGGIAVKIQVQNAPAGNHGIHIHETGSCDQAGQAAGGHFNPDTLPHGNLIADGLTKAHAGDLGNIEVLPDGTGTLEAEVKGLTLDQTHYGILGRSVILHEKLDDFGQPTGNAGGRIACGLIETKPAPIES